MESDVKLSLFKNTNAIVNAIVMIEICVEINLLKLYEDLKIFLGGADKKSVFFKIRILNIKEKKLVVDGMRLCRKMEHVFQGNATNAGIAVVGSGNGQIGEGK